MKSRMSRIFLWMDLKLHDYYVSSCLTCQINFSLVSVGTIWTNGTACSVLLVSTSIAKSNSFMFICLFCPLGSRHLVKLLSSHQRRFFLLLAWVLSIQSVNKKKKKNVVYAGCCTQCESSYVSIWCWVVVVVFLVFVFDLVKHLVLMTWTCWSRFQGGAHLPRRSSPMKTGWEIRGYLSWGREGSRKILQWPSCT